MLVSVPVSAFIPADEVANLFYFKLLGSNVLDGLQRNYRISHDRSFNSSCLQNSLIAIKPRTDFCLTEYMVFLDVCINQDFV